MTFADHLAKQAREITEARKRIGQQAADRAEANGFDPDAEAIVKAISGEYRRVA